MTFENVTPISSVDLSNQATTAVQYQPAVAPKQAPAKPAEPQPAPAPVEERPQEPKSRPILTSDVQLKFIVDEKSNNITVLVLDRANQRVIRAIPPEELNSFQGGDLLSLFA